VSRLAQLTHFAFSPSAPRRSATLALTERLSAVTHLTSSLEYLARGSDRDRGGLNNWDVMRHAYQDSRPWQVRVLDIVGDRRATSALHVARVAAAVTLLAPTSRKPRVVANSFLAASSALLYKRHLYGTDGTDQVSIVVQAATAVARAGERHPETVDACLWFIGLQSVLSYTAAGWAKIVSPTWRSGEALPGILRTQAYGDRTAWELVRRYPRTAKTLGASVLAMECLFPAVFVGRGRLARPFVASAAAFHLTNGRVMGLGRFVWSFIAMHPAVLYVAGRPRGEATSDGAPGPGRHDLMPMVAAGLAAGLLGAGLAVQGRRRRTVLRVSEEERTLRASSGNVLSYRTWGRGDSGPVVVFEAGLMWGPEQYEKVTRELSSRYQTVTYRRAGYGSSQCAAARDYTLGVSVEDLADLAMHVGEDRPIVLAGHSLGGYLCYLAASRLGDRISGVCLLDPSHPAQLHRSIRQAAGSEQLMASLGRVSGSLRFGLGPLLRQPEWVSAVTAGSRKRAVAEYRDARLWRAGRREWTAARRHFDETDGKIPVVDVPLLIVTAEKTVSVDPVQQELHDEFAGKAPWAESHLMRGVSHAGMVSDPAAAREVAGLMEAFIDRVKGSE
jgi:pimeloyl-ACP methyl ester carboxylesterase